MFYDISLTMQLLSIFLFDITTSLLYVIFIYILTHFAVIYLLYAINMMFVLIKSTLTFRDTACVTFYVYCCNHFILVFHLMSLIIIRCIVSLN